MSAEAQDPHLTGIANVLVMERFLTAEDATSYLAKAKAAKMPFVPYLVEHKVVSARDVAVAGSRNFGVPLLDLNYVDREVLPLGKVSEKLITRHHALPIFQRGNQLFLAVSDPSQQLILDEIKFHTGLRTRAIVVEADKLTKLIEESLNARESAALSSYLDDSSLDDLDISSGVEDTDTRDEPESADDAPIVRFVNKILLDAIKSGASDIHFEPYERIYRVRFRTDGMLNEVANPPVNLGNRIASRLKIMSHLDISERRVPQDGRFMMNLSRKHSIDFRVSTCPTVGGEKVVMRILDPTVANMGIDALGFSPEQKQLYLTAIHQPQGMVLVTGPTGSGKTVTLYTALNILNQIERNISTAEDPVEIKVSGINQVNINLKAGLTFSGALRSFLRQDPDVIMVGEMRDLETAEIGVKAAQTGHMVLSTLHTNSAPETLTRLRNMGVEPFNIASSVSLIIAQRLVRRLCEKCKTPISIPTPALLDIGFSEQDIPELKLFHPVGCESCSHGYKGRVGLYEVLPITPIIGEMIMTGGSSIDIAKEARKNGVLSIRQAGLEKIKSGVTTIEELLRVTKE